MELRRLQYSNVYGYLSGDLTFTHGENFLVGINGCGKTTVLNLIQWILEPALQELCTLEHETITLELKHGKYLYTIKSSFKKGKHELKVTSKDKSRELTSISTQLLADPKVVRKQPYYSEVKAAYESLSPETDEVATWSFLREDLPSPVFIGLERNVREMGITRPLRKNRRPVTASEVRSPHLAGIELMRDAFNTGRRKLVEINEDLNREVLELSFSGIIRPEELRETRSRKDIAERIRQLKDRFQDSSRKGEYSKALSTAEVSSAVVSFLKELEKLLASKVDDIWITLNQHNFDRASKMFDLFLKHEHQAKMVQSEIRTFTDEVNIFLNDSGKSIHFDEDTGAPFFKSSSFKDTLSLVDLSSGEAQIVILLSYFAFLAKTGIPIVIDEPELSLHVEWQKSFVKSVKRVMPPECQTIMATHSPEICGALDVNVQAISVRK